MRVRAIATGFDNLTVREVDDEFHMPDGATGSWFVPVEPKPEQKQSKQSKSESLA